MKKLDRLAPEDVVVITGKRRSGKSWMAKSLLASEMSAGARVLAFDPHDEYSVKGRRSKATNLGPLRERVELDQLIDSPDLLDNPRLSLAVVPRGHAGRTGLAEDVKQLVALVRLTGDLVLCFDECGEYSAEARDELNSAATQSRHWGDQGCPCIFVAQRAVQIPKSARDQASVLFTGLQTDPEDLQTLKKLTGNPTFAEAVSRLPRPGLLTWRDTTHTGVTK